ncbi:MAG: transcriptional regulator [Bacteroidales bacterium]
MKSKVLSVLAEAKKPLKSGEIAELSGLDKKEVDGAIKQLRAEDRIVSPKRCFYDIKK